MGAQTAAPEKTPVIHAETRVVQVEVVAIDSSGNPVTGLAKDDFSIRDNGKARAIDIFSVESQGGAVKVPPRPKLPAGVFTNRGPAPVENSRPPTVILLDASNGGGVPFQWARQAVMGVLKKLPPDERIAVYVVARHQGLMLLQDYTSDHALILKRLSHYVAPAPPPPPPPNTRGLTSEESEYLQREATENIRLSLQGLAEHLSLGPGRKNIFFLTPGFSQRAMNEGGKPGWDKTFTALNEANVAVNTVDPTGVHPRTEGIFAEEQIAEETGGRAYFGKNDADDMLAEGIAASHVEYTLGFYLPESEQDSQFHSLQIATSRRGVQLSWRKGYYAGETELPPSEFQKSSKGDLDAALLNRVDETGVGITAHIRTAWGSPRGKLDIQLNADAATLTLKPQKSGQSGEVQELFVQMNDSGDTLARISDQKEFDISAKGEARVLSSGVPWSVSIPLMPAATRLAVVIRDSASGRVGSLMIPLK
ncbi:MAG TPA: VWA domain-containing protein [Bryobacteraceae bacterium]|nr:VWA domain-containing protein [Bryobacteraceae bacterium]